MLHDYKTEELDLKGLRAVLYILLPYILLGMWYMTKTLAVESERVKSCPLHSWVVVHGSRTGGLDQMIPVIRANKTIRVLVIWGEGGG